NRILTFGSLPVRCSTAPVHERERRFQSVARCMMSDFQSRQVGCVWLELMSRAALKMRHSRRIHCTNPIPSSPRRPAIQIEKRFSFTALCLLGPYPTYMVGFGLVSRQSAHQSEDAQFDF